MIEDRVLYTVEIVDIVETAVIMYGSVRQAEAVYGRPLPAHDYRFQIRWGGEACDGLVTFNYNATADDVIAWFRREKLLPKNAEEIRRADNTDAR